MATTLDDLANELQHCNISSCQTTTFNDLPVELRIEIFRHCMAGRDVTMLQLNKALFNELEDELYGRNIFTITIDPSRSEPWVKMSVGGSEFWLPVHSEHVHEPTCLTGKKIPFHRLKQLEIRVFAPDTQDPGQAVRAWHQVTRMLNWLLPRQLTSTPDVAEEPCFEPAINNRGFRLPKIQVTFIEKEDRIWGNSLAPMSTNPLGDIITLLYAFVPLRRCRSLTVNMPDHCVTSHTQAQPEILRKFAIANAPMGVVTEAAIWYEEDQLQRLIYSWHVVLHDILDDLAGPSAAQLRLERFTYWCSLHVQHQKDRICGRKHVNRARRFGGFATLEQQIEHANAFWMRQLAHLMCTLHLIEQNCSYNNPSSWEMHYPHGIPPKSSDEFPAMRRSDSGAQAYAMGLLPSGMHPRHPFRCCPNLLVDLESD